MEEAAWPRTPLQDDVVSSGPGQEVSHLQSCRSSSQDTVVVLVAAAIIRPACHTADRDEQEKKDQVWTHVLQTDEMT